MFGKKEEQWWQETKKQEEKKAKSDAMVQEVKESDVELSFLQQLQSGAILCTVVDEDDEKVGYVIITPSKEIEIIESIFYEYEDTDRNHLRNQAQKFFKAL